MCVCACVCMPKHVCVLVYVCLCALPLLRACVRVPMRGCVRVCVCMCRHGRLWQEDFIKCLAPTYMGDFALAGTELRKKGTGREHPREYSPRMSVCVRAACAACVRWV